MSPLCDLTGRVTQAEAGAEMMLSGHNLAMNPGASIPQ
jgi:hypothetical protein